MGKTKKGEASTSKGTKRTTSEREGNVYRGCEGMSKDYKDLFEYLESKLSVAVTKFPMTIGALDNLGLIPMLRLLLRKVGLDGAINSSTDTKKSLTLEFLTTIEKVTLDEGVPGIRFRAKKRYYDLSYDEIRDALHITKPPQPIPIDTKGVNTFWTQITGDPHTKNTKNTNIPHAALRLASRFINTNYLCQSEPTKLNNQNTSFLWAMTPDGEGVPDWAHLFVEGCFELKKGKKGTLFIGGMIGKLLSFAGVPNLHEIPNLPGSTYMDLAYLMKMGAIDVIQEHPLEVIWKVGGAPNNKRYMYLPRPPHSPLGWGRAPDFYMPPDDDFAFLWINQPQVVEEENMGQEEEVNMGEGEEGTSYGGTLPPGNISFGGPSFTQGRTFSHEDMPRAPSPPQQHQYQQQQHQYQQQQQPFPHEWASWQVGVDARLVGMENHINRIQASNDERWGMQQTWHQYYEEDMEEQRRLQQANYDMMVAMTRLNLQTYPTYTHDYTQESINETNDDLTRLRTRREGRRGRRHPGNGGASSSHQ